MSNLHFDVADFDVRQGLCAGFRTAKARAFSASAGSATWHVVLDHRHTLSRKHEGFRQNPRRGSPIELVLCYTQRCFRSVIAAGGLHPSYWHEPSRGAGTWAAQKSGYNGA